MRGTWLIDDKPVHPLELWSKVARIAANEGFIRSLVHRCNCTGLDCDNTPSNPIFGDNWNRCPYPLLNSAHWRAVVFLFKAASVSPLSNFPEGYSAGLVHGLVALKEEVEAKRVKDFEKKTKRKR